MVQVRKISSFSKPLGIEYFALLACASLLFFPLLFGVSIYWPNGSAALFSFEHYLAPLAGLAILGLFLQKDGPRLSAFTHRLRLMLSLGVAVYVHFNLKLWAQLINHRLYDAEYAGIDQHFSGLIDLIELIAERFHRFPFTWPSAYHDVFVSMFVVSMGIHATLGKKSLDHLVTAIAATLILGGLSYMISPALGPFIYQQNPLATQQAMHVFHSEFIQSGGSVFQPGGFIMPLAAMPSLHVAHTSILTWLAFRYCRMLGWIYLPVLLYISIEAIASGWHYLIDVPAGLLVAATCLWLSDRLLLQQECAVAHKHRTPLNT